MGVCPSADDRGKVNKTGLPGGVKLQLTKLPNCAAIETALTCFCSKQVIVSVRRSSRSWGGNNAWTSRLQSVRQRRHLGQSRHARPVGLAGAPDRNRSAACNALGFAASGAASNPVANPP